jgi:hypothetical protein
VIVLSHDYTSNQAWIPLGLLETVAPDQSIHFVHRPMEAVLMGEMQAGSSVTEGIAAMNADEWHAVGFTGAGVKVAIIDGGFSGYEGFLGTNLPATVVVANFVDFETEAEVDGTTEHGTACADIVPWGSWWLPSCDPLGIQRMFYSLFSPLLIFA